MMRLHPYNFGVTGIVRAWNQCRAGLRLCRSSGLRFSELFPDSVNSMTAAWNVWQIFKKEQLDPPNPSGMWVPMKAR